MCRARIDELAEAALMQREKDVYLPRDEWFEARKEISILTREPLNMSHLKMWFHYSNIRFIHQFRQPTADDDYVLCLEAAGFI